MEHSKTDTYHIPEATRSTGTTVLDQLGKNAELPDVGEDRIVVSDDDTLDLGFHSTNLFDEEDLNNPDLATGRVDTIPDDITEAGLEVIDDNARDMGHAAIDATLDDDPTARWIAAMEAGDKAAADEIAEEFKAA